MKSLRIILWGCLAAALALAEAGCTTLTAPVPPTLPSDLTGYFWPNADASFNYVSGTGSSHAVQIKQGGTIIDKDLTTDSSVTLKATSSGGTVTLSGLSSSDLLGLDPSLSVVADTAPSPTAKPIAIRSIATLGRTLYVASDTALYQYLPQGDSLLWVQHPAWNNNVQLYSGRGGSPTGGSLYAVEIGGTHVWWSGKPMNWNASQSPDPSAITCFAPGDGGGANHSQHWIACGAQLYRYSYGVYTPIGQPFSGPIAAMEEEGFGVSDLFVCLRSGAIFQVHEDDRADSLGTVAPNTITSMANGYIGTTNGLYSLFMFPAPRLSKMRGGSVTTLLGWNNYGTGGVFGGLMNDSVFSRSGPAELPFGVPSNAQVTQFADTGMGQLYALAGTQLFELYIGNWILRAQGTVASAKWSPGTFTLLKDDTGWLAAYVENFSSNNIHGYAYLASVVIGKEGSANVQLDGIAYNDVIAVQYTPNMRGIVETVAAPSYLIYFERGKGPIRIERTEAGVKTITRLVQ